MGRLFGNGVYLSACDLFTIVLNRIGCGLTLTTSAITGILLPGQSINISVGKANKRSFAALIVITNDDD